MFGQPKAKPHWIKWAEAEREVAIREFASLCWRERRQQNPVKPQLRLQTNSLRGGRAGQVGEAQPTGPV